MSRITIIQIWPNIIKNNNSKVTAFEIIVEKTIRLICVKLIGKEIENSRFYQYKDLKKKFWYQKLWQEFTWNIRVRFFKMQIRRYYSSLYRHCTFNDAA